MSIPPLNDVTLSWCYFLTRSKFFLPAMHFGKKSAFLWFPAEALVVSVLLLCYCVYCSCCSCCSSSGTDLAFLHSALDLVSSLGSWKKPWCLATISERSGTFYPVTLALFLALLLFSISKDSSESVTESVSIAVVAIVVLVQRLTWPF